MDSTTILYVVLGAIALVVLVLLLLRKTPQARELVQPHPKAPLPPAAEAQAAVVPVPPHEPADQGLMPGAQAAAIPTPRPPKVEARLPLRQSEVLALKEGLSSTRGGLITRLGRLFRGKTEIDPALIAQVEEVLITSDVGVKTTQKLIDHLKENLGTGGALDPHGLWTSLREEAVRILDLPAPKPPEDKPYVAMIVGVNGVGKTTTIGKLASRWTADGKKVVLAAGDTFRAAAVQQLEIWGRRTGCPVIKGKEGADPSSVVFDAVKAAKEEGADVVIADTAGRLHTKQPLMEELKKIKRVAAKAYEAAPHDVFLVLDATNGQNAIAQVQMFKEALDITGIVLTKLDGTAKGGVILGICDEHRIPVRFVGIGERVEDLREFRAEEFVEALFFAAEEESIAA